MVDPDVLATLPLFAPLDQAQLREVAAWFELREVSEGVELIGSGAPGYSFFILTDGAAAVTSEQGMVAALAPGDFFGEGAIIGDGRRHATVTTTAPSHVLVMFGTEFRRMQQSQPALAATIESVARNRLH
jgi:voltage-gated potassium channel